MDQGKMKKVTIKAPDPKPETEKAKRIYRAVGEIIKRHDEIVKQKRGYRDVFMPDAIMLRDRLQEYCERLMFYCPAEYGRKAEEVLWRKAFYEVIQLMKHNVKHVSSNHCVEKAYRTHLTSAMGYYHHLLFRLQSEFEQSLDGIVDFYYLPEDKTHRKPFQSVKAEPEPEVSEWALQACHRCLLYLGDLARYQHDYDGMPSKVSAQRYYYQAMALCPQIGMPCNQLGTLAGNSFYSLNAAYYYIRCIVCPIGFDGAHNNLIRLFERNHKRLVEVNELPQQGVSQEQQRSRDVKRFVTRFLYLLEIFYTNSKNVDAKGIQEACQSTLHDFNLCMFSQPNKSLSTISSRGDHATFAVDDKLCYFEDEMVFKIFVICLAIIFQMQKNGNRQVAAAIAFSLALFSHVLNHVMIRLQSMLYELENPQQIFKISSSTELNDIIGHADVDDNFDNTNTTRNKQYTSRTRRQSQRNKQDLQKETNKEDDAKKDKKKKKTSKLRRMRRRKGSGSSSDSDGNLIKLRNGSDASDDEFFDVTESESGDENSGLVCELSSSDSDDNLMVSQELRPGFCQPSSDATELDELDELTSEEHLDSAIDAFNSVLDVVIKEASPSPCNQLPPSTNVPKNDSIPDMTEFLKDIPLDWLSDAANLLSRTLKFTYASSNLGPSDENNPEISAVVQCTKDVRVPPGFEKSSEFQHVMEISEKLANFDIETDTDVSVYPTDTENSTVTESEFDTETETDKESVVDRSEQEVKRLRRLVEVATTEGLLASIKVYCDWMRVNPHIVATCAKISSSIWYRLSVLLNFLPSEADLARIELCGTDRVLALVQQALDKDVILTQPLIEDFHLQKFPSLETAHKDLLFGRHSRLDLSDQQEAILRLCYLRRFGYFITKLKSVQFTYSSENGMFYGPQQTPTPNAVNDKQAEQKLVSAEARRNQLMRDMAQLRLQAEVSQLEGSLKTSDTQPKLPPYLVPDAPSLCDHWSQLRQLAMSSKFIIIIPLTVVDHLDLLKKDNSGARDAIRWLEGEFKKGNRYVRAQKQHENNLPEQKKFLKRDKDAWRFIQIVDCCKYLANQTPNCDIRSMVCLLTKVSINSSDVSIRTKEVISLSLKEGLRMETVIQFFNRWKELTKNDKG